MLVSSSRSLHALVEDRGEIAGLVTWIATFSELDLQIMRGKKETLLCQKRVKFPELKPCTFQLSIYNDTYLFLLAFLQLIVAHTSSSSKAVSVSSTATVMTPITQRGKSN